MKKTIISLALLAAVACVSSGCTAMFVHGGRLMPRNSPVESATGVWDVGPCLDTSGVSAGSPGARYYLFQTASGLELFERSPDGSGMMITNQWNDAVGLHFYTWVQSNGWEYVIPGPGQPASRNVYAGSGTETTADGSARPTGSLTHVCAMTPVGP